MENHPCKLPTIQDFLFQLRTQLLICIKFTNDEQQHLNLRGRFSWSWLAIFIFFWLHKKTRFKWAITRWEEYDLHQCQLDEDQCHEDVYSWRPYLLGGRRWFTGSGELSHPDFTSCSLDPRHPHQYKYSHLHHHHNYVHRHRNWSLLSSLLDWLSIQLSPRWPRLFHQSCNDHY